MRNLIRQILSEELSVKKGDKLMATKTIPGSRTAGKIYTVLGTHNTPYNREEEVMFINDAGRVLTFNLSDVKNHFIPFDYDSTSNIFNQLDPE